MAVDANVIIYERIREELRAGKSLLTSIAEGFKHSMSAILDSNMTTLLIGIVLIYFGTGPLKGFGTVLIVGIIFTVFTAKARILVSGLPKQKIYLPISILTGLASERKPICFLEH